MSLGDPIAEELDRRAKFETKISNPKLETLSSKQTRMAKTQNPKPYESGNIRSRG
jgi:hypothetical protein